MCGTGPQSPHRRTLGAPALDFLPQLRLRRHVFKLYTKFCSTSFLAQLLLLLFASPNKAIVVEGMKSPFRASPVFRLGHAGTHRSNVGGWDLPAIFPSLKVDSKHGVRVPAAGARLTEPELMTRSWWPPGGAGVRNSEWRRTSGNAPTEPDGPSNALTEAREDRGGGREGREGREGVSRPFLLSFCRSFVIMCFSLTAASPRGRTFLVNTSCSCCVVKSVFWSHTRAGATVSPPSLRRSKVVQEQPDNQGVQRGRIYLSAGRGREDEASLVHPPPGGFSGFSFTKANRFWLHVKKNLQ